jgi:hypothetical protein
MAFWSWNKIALAAFIWVQFISVYFKMPIIDVLKIYVGCIATALWALITGIIHGLLLVLVTIAIFALFNTRPVNYILKFHARFLRFVVKNQWSRNVGYGSGPFGLSKTQKPREWRRNIPYKYSPLGHDQMRLLNVICYLDGGTRHFELDLVHVTRETPEQKYLAISYTWGDPRIVARIPCGDRGVIGVTQSVLTILETLVSSGRPLYLWIDALCINQEDNEEKGQQVRFMDQVYAHAHQVVVCLGKPDSDSDEAMDSIYPLQRAYSASGTGTVFKSQELVSYFEPLGRFLRRPWFSRIWVIQEVALASDVVLVCGSRVVQFHDFINVLSGIAMWGHEVLIRGLDTKGLWVGPFLRAPEGYVNGVRICEILRKFREVKKMPFPEALMAVSHFNSTDPRDKIYGLLGFADVPLDNSDMTFQPNYEVTNTAESLYISSAPYLLEWDPPMFILQLAGVGFPRPQHLKNLPSWVPDWSSVDKEVKCFGSERRSKFCAGGPLVTKPKPLGLGSKLLAIDGMVIDNIAEQSLIRPLPLKGNLPKTFHETSLRDSLLRKYKAESLTWFHEVEKMVASASKLNESWKTSGKKSYPHGETTEPVTWKLAFALTMASGERPLNGTPDDTEYMELWKNIIDLHRDGSAPYLMKARAFNYNSICNYATSSRKFFTTSGGFIGLTSPGSEIGDAVCLLPGAVTPFIMRRNQQTWTLVGEAYIHGLMYGQGLGKGKMERFIVE